MSAYLQRLAQRTGLVSTGNSALATGDATAPLEVDLYREVASTPAMAADPGPSPGPESAPSTPTAPMPPSVSFDIPNTEATKTTPIEQPPGRPAFEQRSFESTSRPRRQEPRPAQPVTPVPARRAGPDSSERPKDTLDGLGLEKGIETHPPQFAPIVPAPPLRQAVSVRPAETRHPSNLEPTRSPSPTPEEPDVWIPPKPRSASTARTPMAAPSPTPVAAPLASPVRRTYSPNPPPRPVTNEAKGGPPHSVRIGNVHVEVHQPPPPIAAPTPAPTPRPAPAPAPRPLSLRRLYLRGW